MSAFISLLLALEKWSPLVSKAIDVGIQLRADAKAAAAAEAKRAADAKLEQDLNSIAERERVLREKPTSP